MYRFYIGSLAGLILFFGLSIIAYESIVFGGHDNYDHQVLQQESEAAREVFNTLLQHTDLATTETALARYINKTGANLHIFDQHTLPDSTPVNTQLLTHSAVYIDSDETIWFALEGSPHYYQIVLHSEDLVYQQLNNAEDLLWVFWGMGFAGYCIFLAWYVTRRYKALEKTTLAFAEGDFHVRAPEEKSKSLGSLNLSFNYMAEKISSLISTNKALSHAIAHDLRTPIFRIQWLAEISHGKVSDPELLIALESIIEDTEELEGMVDDLLYHARLERADFKFRYQCINIHTWLTQQLSKFQQITSKTIQLHVDKPLVAEFDPALMKRAFDNLVNNALRYAEAGIVVHSTTRGSLLVISIQDDGPGIAPEHEAQLFKPFYRVESDRNKQTGGYGLGLSIVHQVLHRHRGHVRLVQPTEQTPLTGACFEMSLPLKAALHKPDKQLQRQDTIA